MTTQAPSAGGVAAGRTARLAGVRTRVLDEGAGPAVLLLHGNPDNADEWRGVIDRLASDHRCIAPDLPGYGTRGRTFDLPPTFDYGLPQQVQFVDDLLEALAIDDVTLVVHDIGGIMGVPWAARNTARLRGVVYTNTVAFEFRWFPLARLWGSRRWQHRLRARAMMGAMGLAGGALFRRGFAQQNPQLPDEQLDRFVRDFACNPVAKATTLRQFATITARDFFADYADMLQTIADAVETRTVWGDGDPYVPDARAEDLGAATLRRLQGVGHWVPLLAADAVADAVRRVERAPAGT